MGVATDLFEDLSGRPLTDDQLAARRRRAELSGPNVEITADRRLVVKREPQQARRIVEIRLPEDTTD
jgi:hypothetical protein